MNISDAFFYFSIEKGYLSSVLDCIKAGVDVDGKNNS